MAVRARGLSHASRTAAIDRRSAAAMWTMSSSSSAPPIRSTTERRVPGRAGTRRRRWRSPRNRIEAPSRSPPRAASSARSSRLTGEVSAEPRLTLGEERPDVALRVCPPPAADRRHGHDDAAVRVDDDPQAAGSRGAAKRVRQRPAGKPRDRGRLDRASGGRAPARDRHDRRSRRPGRSPVSAPARIAGRPLTTTWSMPVG